MKDPSKISCRRVLTVARPGRGRDEHGWHIDARAGSQSTAEGREVSGHPEGRAAL
jgi:hypothetical protein